MAEMLYPVGKITVSLLFKKKKKNREKYFSGPKTTVKVSIISARYQAPYLSYEISILNFTHTLIFRQLAAA